MSECPSDRLGSVFNRLTNGPCRDPAAQDFPADVVGLPDPQGGNAALARLHYRRAGREG